jgi:hypothetical protein
VKGCVVAITDFVTVSVVEEVLLGDKVVDRDPQDEGEKLARKVGVLVNG